MIFIACPAHFATGGTELLHQLYFELKKYTDRVKMYYLRVNDPQSPTADRFKKYQVEYTYEVTDESNSALIVPEVLTSMLRDFQHLKKYIWWLSVDNYKSTIGQNHRNVRDFFGFTKKYLTDKELRKSIKKSKVDFNNAKFGHWCQSYYSIDFLDKMDVKNRSYLSDYIGDNFLNESYDTKQTRVNRVLYNPAKGIGFTRKLINSAPEIEFVPLKNLSQEAIIQLLKESKIYIDFGNHPGKDRFPREAAYMGCVILTGQRGAAKFDQDVPIPKNFKFPDRKREIPKIILSIKNIFENFNQETEKFETYRNFISQERTKFEEDVKAIWTQDLIKFGAEKHEAV